MIVKIQNDDKFYKITQGEITDDRELDYVFWNIIVSFCSIDDNLGNITLDC